VAAGASISPDVKVEVQDAGGNRISTSTAPVTMSLGTNPGGATLSGTRTVNAVAGVATFTDLRINRVGNGYTLSAASPGLTDAVSSTFNVTPGAAATMRFGVQPSDVVAGAAISPAITVELLDAQGNIATGAAPQVSLSLGNNPGGATLSGTTTVAAVAGVATFTGLNLNAVGAGYTLVAASAGLPVVASAGFTVTAGAPATLSFITQPGSTVAGASISPAVQLDLRDAQGNLVTTPTQVTISLGNNPGGATLGGTLTVSTVGGVATFEGLTMDVVGAGYTLSAAAAGLTATSTPFDVTPGPATQLAFLVQPTDINENLPFTPDVAVEVRDAFGNRVTGFAGSVSLQLRSATGGGAGTGNQLVGGVARPFVQGVAVFTDMTVNFTSIVLATRTFTLRTQNSIAVVSSTPFTVSPF
jgi:hypothetical protein